jgi:WD40 repeat protein
LASGSEDKTIKLWNVEQHKEINTLQAHDGHIRSVIFSPDGKYLASGSEDKMVILWKIEE